MLSNKTTTETKDDNIYYNIDIVNNNKDSKQAIFAQQLTGSILDDPSLYYMAVARFSITGTILPIFLFVDNGLASTDPGYTSQYSVSLTYNGFTGFSYVKYDINSAGPYNSRLNHPIYSYTQFLEMINNAFADAFTALNTASGGLPGGSSAPYMLYNPNGGIMSIYAQGSYFLDTLSTPINIYMNITLYRFFDNFYTDFLTETSPIGQDVRIIVIDLYGSNSEPIDPSVPTGYLKLSQEYSNNQRMFQPNSIVFKTFTMGVRPEFIQGANSSDDLINGSNSGSGIPFDAIMTDFIPSFSSTEQAGWRQDLVYNAQLYRLIDLLGNKSNVVDLAIFWRDQQANEYPLYIEGNKSVSVKLIFIKKSLYKNYHQHQVVQN